MEICNDKIILEIDFEGKETIRQVVLGMKRLSWYERTFESPLRLMSNFIMCLLIFYLVGWITTISILLSFTLALIISSFSPGISFQIFSSLAIYFENQYKKKNGYTVTVPYKLQLDEDGIKMTSSSQRIESKWAEIVEAIETEKDLAIFYDRVNCFLFPKRLFFTFEELTFFKNFIRQKISDRAKF